MRVQYHENRITVVGLNAPTRAQRNAIWGAAAAIVAGMSINVSIGLHALTVFPLMLTMMGIIAICSLLNLNNVYDAPTLNEPYWRSRLLDEVGLKRNQAVGVSWDLAREIQETQWAYNASVPNN